MNRGWRFKGNERRNLDESLSAGMSAGPDGTMNERLEDAFSRKVDRQFAVACNSGTSALHMALAGCSVGPGDEVIIPGLTVAMCGFVVKHCGATPVFADVRPDTFLVDPNDVERKVTSKTKAIMPVHLYGLMCSMDAIMDIAKRHNLYVVEDCAESLFSSDGKGRMAGTIGHVGCWSFETTKHISTGEGGMVAADDETLARNMRKFGGLGFKNLTAKSGKVKISLDKFQDPNWERHDVFGLNYRMPEVCAAVSLAQLEISDEFVQRRNEMGKLYTRTLNETNTPLLTPQTIPSGYVHTYWTFAALFNGKDFGIEWQAFRRKHMEFGGDGIYAAWQTVPNEPAFRESDVGWGDVPVANRIQKQMMQFATNQEGHREMEGQARALRLTIEFFHDSLSLGHR